MKKRGIAVLLAVAMLCPYALQVCADTQDIADTSVNIQVASDSVGYSEYISGRKDLIGKGEPMSIQAVGYSASDGAELLAEELLYWTNAKGSITYTFDAAVSGAYNIELCYKSLGESADPAEIAVLIDGSLPFEEAGSMFLNRLYTNDGDIRHDSDKNEFAPKTAQVEALQSVRL